MRVRVVRKDLQTGVGFMRRELCVLYPNLDVCGLTAERKVSFTNGWSVGHLRLARFHRLI